MGFIAAPPSQKISGYVVGRLQLLIDSLVEWVLRTGGLEWPDETTPRECAALRREAW